MTICPSDADVRLRKRARGGIADIVETQFDRSRVPHVALLSMPHAAIMAAPLNNFDRASLLILSIRILGGLLNIWKPDRKLRRLLWSITNCYCLTPPPSALPRLRSAKMFGSRRLPAAALSELAARTAPLTKMQQS